MVDTDADMVVAVEIDEGADRRTHREAAEVVDRQAENTPATHSGVGVE